VGTEVQIAPCIAASSVGMLTNLKTHHVSPQFHVIYNGFFEMVHSSDANPHPQKPGNSADGPSNMEAWASFKEANNQDVTYYFNARSHDLPLQSHMV